MQGQVVAVAAVGGHAFEAVAVMAAGLLAGAVVAGLTHLTQEFQLDLKRLVLKALLVELILQDGKFISVDFHSDTPHFLSGAARKRNGGAVLCISRIAEKAVPVKRRLHSRWGRIAAVRRRRNAVPTAGAKGGKGTKWFPCPLLTPPNPPLR